MNYLPKEDQIYFQKYTMWKQFDTLYWGFTCFSRQDYSNVVKIPSVDEIIYGVYSTKGGTLAEMTMRWEYMNGELVPSIRTFSDAFLLLGSPTCQNLIRELLTQKFQTFTSDDFSRLLIKAGFHDNSDRKLGD